MSSKKTYVSKLILLSPSFFLCLIFIALNFLACRPSSKWQEGSLLFFDTICDLKLYCQAEEFSAAVSTVREIFTHTEALFSPSSTRFKGDEILELYQLAKKIYLDSGGAFDITVGTLARVWGFTTKSYRVPSAAEIQQALSFVGLDKLQERNGELIVPAGVILDWGGIAKGWAVDQAAKALRRQGIERGFINAGGDLICWGQNPAGQAWRIGLKHPRQSGFLGVLELENQAVATSGDYQRFFEVKGVRYHHIFNPKTGYPATGKQSVTVIGPETAVCDGLSTAIFIITDPGQLLQAYPEYGAIIVNDRGEVFIQGKSFPFQLLER